MNPWPQISLGSQINSLDLFRPETAFTLEQTYQTLGASPPGPEKNGGENMI